MADNTVTNPGSGGDTIATDDVSGVKHQRVKVEFGTDGVATDVSASNPLPMTQAADMLASNPVESTPGIPVRPVPNKSWRTTFAKVIASGVDSTYWSLLQTGSGMAVSQSAGNLVVTTGTTANAETVIRSLVGWYDTFLMRELMQLSQRIANQSFFVEMVDVIGDGLSYVINSATSVTVTIPSNPFTSQNVGQSMNLGVITGAAGIPGRYAIASVSGNNVTFTVAAWPASGSGTLSLFGWNFHQVLYDGTTATNAKYDAARDGWATGATTATINTTASSGHVAQLFCDDSIATLVDALAASSTSNPYTQRASRMANIPAPTTKLYLQIRVLNGTSAPASTTTMTMGFVAVEEYVATPVTAAGGKYTGSGAAQPAIITNTVVVDSEITTAAALADAFANPTTGHVAADEMMYNGGSWDRERNNFNTATGDTGAKTATTAGATQTNYNARGAIITIVMGTVSGTSPTCAPQLQYSDDGGTTWTTLGPAMANITASGTYVFVVYPANISQTAGATPANLTTGATTTVAINSPLPRTWRLNYTIGGTTPSFTITRVGVNYIN